jgi:hypothetical protein
MENGHGRSIILMTAVYLAFFLLAAAWAVLLSTGGQSGHITAWNAFFAPFMGPWSPVLPPNPHAVSFWSLSEILKAVLLSILFMFCMVASFLNLNRYLLMLTRFSSVILLFIWIAHGILKVILELR